MCTTASTFSQPRRLTNPAPFACRIRSILIGGIGGRPNTLGGRTGVKRLLVQIEIDVRGPVARRATLSGRTGSTQSADRLHGLRTTPFNRASSPGRRPVQGSCAHRQAAGGRDHPAQVGGRQALGNRQQAGYRTGEAPDCLCEVSLRARASRCHGQ